MPAADLLVVHAADLATLRGPARARRGPEMADAGIVKDGAVAIANGRIAAVGTTDEIARGWTAKETIDATGRLVTPGLVDAHTHLIFAGTREDEFEKRTQGVPYMEIAKAGGGILSTVDKVRAASVAELVALARPRLDSMLAHGTTTADIKSGYGLSTADEVKSLQAIQALTGGVRLVPTFLGAHEVPREFAGRRPEYVDVVVNEMIPAAKSLARFCDVFCEQGVFTPAESRRILLAARGAGMQVKLHADEFAPSGAAELAGEIRAVSADHLMAVSDAGIKALAASGVIAVMLPGTSFFLGGARYAPARKLIAEGVPLALGTDCNPGSCMTWNLQIVMTIACTQLKLTPAEALSAATVNAAFAVGEPETGIIDPGKHADLVIWNAPNLRSLPYLFGVNQVRQVVIAGRSH